MIYVERPLNDPEKKTSRLNEFLTSLPLASCVLEHDLAIPFLEEDRTFLLLRVELAADERAGLDVLLCSLTEHLVLAHDALVSVADELKVLLRGVLVVPHLVVHCAFCGALWHELLNEEEVLCDGEGDIGEAVGGANLLSESLAIFGCVGLVLDVVARGITGDVVGLKVDQASGQIWVCSCAVVALVEVVGQNFPVERANKVPGVVKDVVVKVELLESRLFVDMVKAVLPCDLRLLLGVHVDPNEAVLVEACVNGIFRAGDSRVASWNTLVFDARVVAIVVNKFVGSLNLARLIPCDVNIEVGYIVVNSVAGLKSRLVGHE